MCGIVGIVSAGDRHPAGAETVRRMADRLRHRGPDADGFHDAPGVHLGMRRLAVIDPATGNQPIYNETGTIAVVFNGEIYNFQQLRDELEARGHLFATATDTEVIVHLYEEEGLDAFGRLNGMFAIALHDAVRERTVLARDPQGIKPLLWTQDGYGVRFASEAQALFADPTVSRSPDLEALLDYLVHWYVPTPRSAYAGVHKLTPGHLLVIEADGRTLERAYPRPPLVDGPPLATLEEATAEAQRALEDAVRRQLVADVPVGIFLSSGLDSALVATLAARLAPSRLRAFTVSFRDHASYDEAPLAEAIARHAGLEHVPIPFPSDPSPLAAAALASFDEPFGDFSSIPVTLLCREARRWATVCLSGDGGDEMFAGYPHYRAPAFASVYQRLPGLARRAVSGLVDALPASFEKMPLDYMARRFVRGATAPPLEAHLLYKAIFFGPERERLLGPVLAPYAARDPMLGLATTLDEVGRTNGSLLHQLLRLDRRTFLLDDCLVKVDRVSMAASLEVRVPLLDHLILDTAARIPAEVLLAGGASKAVLRQVAKRVLPPEIRKLKKMGFTPPLSHWLIGPLGPLIDDVLAPERVRRARLVDPEAVATLLAEHRARRRDRSREIWTLVSLHEWWSRNEF